MTHDITKDHRTISPTVIVNGRYYCPPGWVWLAAFASAGFDWAIEALEKYKEQQMTEITEARVEAVAQKSWETVTHTSWLMADDATKVRERSYTRAVLEADARWLVEQNLTVVDKGDWLHSGAHHD